ncbi:hypothetical protein DPMN_093230 [Dreissena polymorpha]|uniref:Uncharacterized protein n=1 Tax=Dreissena polymorpha TaxID=45954 RepID=A0A9D4R1N6_DREPO|nr:hypothetical protein DPMN_093230 [Dreissena polymorpha]
MSGVNLKYIKGVRTRFFNALEKEVCDGGKILDVDISALSLEEYSYIRKQINECKGKIDVYNKKLSNQSEKLAEEQGDTDEELTNKIFQEESTLSEKALSVSYKLNCIGEDLKESEMFQQKKEKRR